jgi:hypothetical protein
MVATKDESETSDFADTVWQRTATGFIDLDEIPEHFRRDDR